jgi:hypothetical protein
VFSFDEFSLLPDVSNKNGSFIFPHFPHFAEHMCGFDGFCAQK